MKRKKYKRVISGILALTMTLTMMQPVEQKAYGYSFEDVCGICGDTVSDHRGIYSDSDTVIGCRGRNCREDGACVGKTWAECLSGSPGGKLGENISWEIRDGNTLVISGTGAMPESVYEPEYRSYQNMVSNNALCHSITSVVIQAGITSISDYTCTGMINVTSVTIPNSVTTIGEKAFNRTGLTSVTIPNRVTTIGKMAFEQTGLTSVTIPDSVTSIGTRAFCNTSLTSITIPDSVTSIGEKAFGYSNYNTALETFEIIGNEGGAAKAYFDDNKPETGWTFNSPHTHTWEYSLEGTDTIKAHCTVEGHTGDYVSLTLTANDGNYSGISASELEAFNEATGRTTDEQKIKKSDVKFYKVTTEGATTDGTLYEGTLYEGRPTEAGNYYAELSVENATAVVAFKANKVWTAADGTYVDFTRLGVGDMLSYFNGNTNKYYISSTEQFYFFYKYNPYECFFSADDAEAEGFTKYKVRWIDAENIYRVFDDAYSFTIVADPRHPKYDNGIGKLAGHSLTLDGNIGVNYFMELDESVITDPDAYMLFKLPNGETQEVKISEDNKEIKDGKTLYKFRCNVAAKEMADEIQATMISGSKQIELDSYSVKDYASQINNNPQYTSVQNLVEAMLNLGTISQKYFNHNTDIPAYDGAAIDLSNITAETIDKPYSKSTEILPSGVTLAGTSLTLEAETELNLFFKNESGKELTFTTSDNVTLTPTTSGELIKVKITNIAAQHLDDDVTVNVSVADDNNTYSVKYSPLNYCYTVLNSNDTDESLRNVVRALYNYNQEANAYFDNNNGGN